MFPEIRLIEAMMNRFVVLEDYVIYQAAPPPDLSLPTTLGFDLNLIVVGLTPSIIQERLPFAIGTVVLIPPPGRLCNVCACVFCVA